jgi:transposase
LVPGSSVSVVARRYDVNANQVFAWRHRYRGTTAGSVGLQLMPVTVIPDRPVGTVPSGELIEIVLNGYRVRVGDDIKASTLRLVLDVLERR